MRKLVFVTIGALVGVPLCVYLAFQTDGLRPSTLTVRNETPTDIRVFVDTTQVVTVPANSMSVLDAGRFSGRWLLPPGRVLVEGGPGRECTWQDAKRNEPLVVRWDSINCGNPPGVYSGP